MLALVFNQRLHLAEDYPEPVLVPGEALIRPHLVGICNTDIEITRGYKGFRGVLGHEFVGTVIACDDPAWLGRRVVGEINAACGRCAVCARGDQSHCPERTTLGIHRRDGAMAECFSLPIRCLHAVAAAIPDTAAVFAEPLAAAVEILQQTYLRPTDQVAVIGDGKLGLLCAQVVRLPGCAVTVVGRHPERWDRLARQGIATLHSNETASRQCSFDVVVDCSGHPSGLATARQLVKPRGRLVLKSTFAAESNLDLSQLVVDEIQLLGSRCGPFAPALRLLERNLIETQPLIAGRMPLSQAERAMQMAERQLKILLEV
ncbi:MAG TPA: alcohol dehydrogenase catalytic domain-containing protein [Roseiflexaceae bacterium]|nr:alcohol dehydrogenase catalytic domain-containing protein [Roseiflexaceae bacterium]